jgi:hypothetical protein
LQFVAEIGLKAIKKAVSCPDPFDFIAVDSTENQNFWALVAKSVSKDRQFVRCVPENEAIHKTLTPRADGLAAIWRYKSAKVALGQESKRSAKTVSFPFHAELHCVSISHGK